MVRIPKSDGGKYPSMNSRSTTQKRTDGDDAATNATVERELRAALEAADSHETRFHLRQALQLVEAYEGPR
jgi:hypothetical protein